MANIKTKAASGLSDVSVDEDKRLITGIASTPRPDRAGDVVKAEGAKFTLPFPLLANHDSRMPVGQVIAMKATARGLEFTAQVGPSDPNLPEVDRAWAQIKAGLVTNVSIGFMATRCELLPDMSGLLISESDIFELSLTPTPCNADAKILTVKSLEDALQAVETFKAEATVVAEVPDVTPKEPGENPGAVTPAGETEGEHPDPAQAVVLTPEAKTTRQVKLNLSFRRYH